MDRPTSTRWARLGVLALVISSASFAAPTASLGAPSTISATDDDKWQPSFTHVVRGSRVVWENPTSETHNVRGYKGPWSKSATLEPGASTSKRFWKVGAYRFRCTIDSVINADGKCEGMCGLVHVARS